MTALIQDYTKNGENFVFGWLGYSQQNEFGKTCLLTSEKNSLKLIIPFYSEADNLFNWFIEDERIPKLKMNADLPETIWVKDINTSSEFVLVENRIAGHTLNLYKYCGKGIITPRRIVMGNHLINYSSINALRSSSPEYRAWTGLSAIETRITPGKDNKFAIETYEAGFSKKDPIQIPSEDIELSFYALGSFNSNNGLKPSITISEDVFLEGVSTNTIDFDKHLEKHHQFRDLICILSWRNIGYKSIQVRHNDDYTAYLDGGHSGPQFRDVISCEFEQWEMPQNENWRYFFYFKDIGNEGLAVWFNLYKRFTKPLQEIAYIAKNSNHLAIESQIVDFGIAFDELGKLIAKEKNEQQVPNSIKLAIERIISDAVTDYGQFPLRKSGVFAQELANTYNAIKHVDFKRDGLMREDYLESTNLLEILFACKLLIIFWIAKRLCCPHSTIISKLREDNILRRIIERWD